MTTGADRRGIPIRDGVETAVAAARVAVSSVSRSAFRRASTEVPPPPPPDFQACCTRFSER